MCNIAGYIGERSAAPILIEMIRAQEGLNGGFYTGIATIDNGKIHYRKVVGDLDELLRRTDAASLPGSIGIIHSRTPGKLGDQWAHPFVCERNGEIINAQVYNGSVGHFSYIDEKRVAIAERLLSDGYKMNSFTKSGEAKRVRLTDGSLVHISDIMCQLIVEKLDTGMNADIAMEKSFCEMPAEIVGLMLSLAEPEAITYARINMPMFVGFADHGAYLASAPQAFPCDAGVPNLFPALSSGYVKKNGFSATAFESAPATVAPLSARVVGECYGAVVEALKEEKHTLPELAKLVKPIFDSADCLQAATAVYAVLYELKKQGILKIEHSTRPGVFDHLTAPIYYLSI